MNVMQIDTAINMIKKTDWANILSLENIRLWRL